MSRVFKLSLGLALILAEGLSAEISKTTTALNAPTLPQAGENFSVEHPVIAMIWVAPGSFWMGSPLGAGDDTHVTLTRGYWLGRTEITQAQWRAVIDHVPVPSLFKGSDRPVERVSWEIAAVFCTKLTEQERRAGRLPAGYVYTLPTEAQWEYACRAGTTGKYTADINDIAWYEGNSGNITHPVAQKQPNAWGFYDMHGNVFEWCADWYKPYVGGPANDPTGPAIGQFRVARGGSWGTPAGGCRANYRFFVLPSLGHSSVHGFRLALAPASTALEILRSTDNPRGLK